MRGWFAVALLIGLYGCGEEPKPKVRKRARPKPVVDKPVIEEPVQEEAAPSRNPIHDELLRQADADLDRARMLYREGSEIPSERLLNSARDAALEARNRYQVLAEVDGPEAPRIRESITQLNQLLKLISDSKKSVPVARAPEAEKPAPVKPTLEEAESKPIAQEEEKAPAPEPEEKPEPEPQPMEEEAKPALAAFADFISTPDAAKIGPAREALMKEARPLQNAAVTILGMAAEHAAFARSNDRKALKSEIEKRDPLVFEELSEKELETALEEMIADKPGEMMRYWALAHLARLAALGAEDSVLRKWGGKLDVESKRRGKERIYSTEVGFLMEELAETGDLKEMDKIVRSVRLKKDDELHSHTSLFRLKRWSLENDPVVKQQRMAGLEEAFRKGRKADRLKGLFRHIADTLRSNTVCGTCEGHGEVDCDNCEDGKVITRCGNCNGSGLARKRKKKRIPRCGKCNGTGQTSAGKCKRCKSGIARCDSCDGVPWKAPDLGQFIALKPCATCDEEGYILAPLWIPCRDCAGLGKRPTTP